MSIRIITDSAADFDLEEAKALGVTVLPLSVRFNEEEFYDRLTITPEQFYERLIEEDTLPKTSQVTPFAYEKACEEALSAGDDVLIVTVSSKLSGCYQSAMSAASFNPERVKVVDSMSASVGIQVLVREAVRLRDAGLSLNQLSSALEGEKADVRILALLDTLDYVQKGGRISATAAFAGKLLGIKPVITAKHGKLEVLGKARGSKSGNNMLVEFVNKEGGIDFDRPFGLAYSGRDDYKLQKYIRDSSALYEGRELNLDISKMGSGIGTYAGPGAIAVAFFTKHK